jgi:hypothetical protein
VFKKLQQEVMADSRLHHGVGPLLLARKADMSENDVSSVRVLDWSKVDKETKKGLGDPHFYTAKRVMAVCSQMVDFSAEFVPAQPAHHIGSF